VLLGDDGFGVEVARRLLAGDGGALPAEVQVADFGIRALHLAYELLEPWDRVVLVDAMSRGAEPGSVFVLEPTAAAGDGPDDGVEVDAHALHPAAVLRLARTLGARTDHVRVVGCEPLDTDERIGLSEPVARAIAEAVRIVQRMLADTSEGGDRCG
jgi:hydrogenase maturation protease